MSRAEREEDEGEDKVDKSSQEDNNLGNKLARLNILCLSYLKHSSFN